MKVCEDICSVTIPLLPTQIPQKALQRVCALQTALIYNDVGKFFRILEHLEQETQFVEDDFYLNLTFETKNRL